MSDAINDFADEFMAMWPTGFMDDRTRIEFAAEALTKDERAEALAMVVPFLADLKRMGRKSIPPGWKYLIERRWKRLKDSEIAGLAGEPLPNAHPENALRDCDASHGDACGADAVIGLGAAAVKGQPQGVIGNDADAVGIEVAWLGREIVERFKTSGLALGVVIGLLEFVRHELYSDGGVATPIEDGAPAESQDPAGASTRMDFALRRAPGERVDIWSPPPAPPPDYGGGGWSITDQLRLRPTLLGCRLERLAIHRDGRREWRRETGAVALDAVRARS